MLEHRGTKLPYQCPGVASHFLCAKSFSEEEARDLSPNSVRQYVHDIPYQQDGREKISRPGNEQYLQPVASTSFEDELLCPVICLQVYKSAINKFRKSETSMEPFLAMVSPHHLVSSSTIARWIKKSLEKAGLEPVFSAHSTRSTASTAAALSGVSTQEIMDRAGCSSKDSFCKFYYGPQSKFHTAKKFGNAMLSYKHLKDMLMKPEPLKYNR